MITIKLRVKSGEIPEKYFQDFGKLKRIAYNRLCDGLSLSDSIKLIESKITHILDRTFVGWAALDAKGLYKSVLEKGEDPKKVIFGGVKKFNQRKNKEISKDEWKEIRNSYIKCIGSSSDPRGNRKVSFDIENSKIFFKPTRYESFCLEFFNCGKKIKELLTKIQNEGASNLRPITVTFFRDKILIYIEEESIKNENKRRSIDSRSASLDLNPNFIALYIADGNKTLKKIVFDLRALGFFTNNNKNKYETLQVSHSIIKLILHYKVKNVFLENLVSERKNSKLGKAFNKILNKWQRQLFVNNFNKNCIINNINIIYIPPEYSSFVGCITNRNDVDSIAAAIEINRRGVEKIKNNTNILFPKWDTVLIDQWKEQLNGNINNWISAFEAFKENPKISYRVLFQDLNPVLFRFRSRHSKVFLADLTERAEYMPSNIKDSNIHQTGYHFEYV